jgi:hypothetical protein
MVVHKYAVLPDHAPKGCDIPCLQRVESGAFLCHELLLHGISGLRPADDGLKPADPCKAAKAEDHKSDSSRITIHCGPPELIAPLGRPRHLLGAPVVPPEPAERKPFFGRDLMTGWKLHRTLDFFRGEKI